MSNVANTMERGKVLTTGRIPRGQSVPLPHKCVDCGYVDDACECPDDNSEQGERDEMQRRAERRAQREDERADAIYAEARGK